MQMQSLRDSVSGTMDDLGGSVSGTMGNLRDSMSGLRNSVTARLPGREPDEVDDEEVGLLGDAWRRGETSADEACEEKLETLRNEKDLELEARHVDSKSSRQALRNEKDTECELKLGVLRDEKNTAARSCTELINTVEQGIKEMVAERENLVRELGEERDLKALWAADAARLADFISKHHMEMADQPEQHLPMEDPGGGSMGGSAEGRAAGGGRKRRTKKRRTKKRRTKKRRTKKRTRRR